MKSFKFARLIGIVALLAAACVSAFPQQSPSATPASKGIVLEVMFFKGKILSYQRIGEWTWYEWLDRPADWKPRPGEVPVAAVKIATRVEDGVIKARVTVLRGVNHETEDFVAEYTLSPEKKAIIRELSSLGVEPFELQLVRAPATVADPPAVVNKTKSLQVSVEPMQSSLPTFLARVLNNSPKPVLCFTYHTSIDGVRRLTGAPRDEAGAIVIKPGETFERPFRYPMKVSAVSTGEVPPALSGLVFNVTSVIFTDGTYEGDAHGAATYLAGNAGQKAQLRSFLEVIRSKEFTNSETEVQAAISSVNVDAVLAEFVQKFPTLTPEQRSSLREAVDYGKSRAVKLFRGASGEPVAILIERLQARIDALP
ncbi:MAG: hypothetical protein ABI481_10295 [Pyrinomonadaceae bacterium]